MLPSMAITYHNSRIPFISGYENGHLNNYTTVFFLGLCYPFSTQEEERKKERDRKGGKKKEVMLTRSLLQKKVITWKIKRNWYADAKGLKVEGLSMDAAQ